LLVGARTRTVSVHPPPVLFDPPEGAVLAPAPAQVTGWFTSEIRRDPTWSFLRVTDAGGTTVSTGDPVLSSDRLQMKAGLKAGLGPGAFTVTWRTWDDNDRAIFGDCYTFFVGQPAADAFVAAKTRLDAGSKCQRIDFEAKDATPAPGQTPTGSASAAESDDSGAGAGGSSSGVATWVLAAGVFGGLIIGLAGGRFLTPRRQ